MCRVFRKREMRPGRGVANPVVSPYYSVLWYLAWYYVVSKILTTPVSLQIFFACFSAHFLCNLFGPSPVCITDNPVLSGKYLTINYGGEKRGIFDVRNYWRGAVVLTVS